MPFLTSFKSLDWPTLCVELVIVFVGITAALWFDNWNQYRVDRQTERQVLTEIANALSGDLRDFEGADRFHSATVGALETLMQRLDDGAALDSQIVESFGTAGGLWTMTPDIGPYEYLRSVGHNIILDDSLRWRITTHYERLWQHHDKVQGGFAVAVDNEYMLPAFVKHFSLIPKDSADLSLVPRDYEALQEDGEFRAVLGLKWFSIEALLGLHGRMADRTEQLRSDILAYLDGP